ncbi:MAG: IPT/TIG domain-containing protein [Prolixibacteraceae bacterium]|nr:IPT/TIG domain-containing protein [Prolixibacteraceae bacterium]
MAIPITVVLYFFVSCGDNETNKGPGEWDSKKPVEIITLFPDSGRVRDQVLIEGSNFGNDTSIIKVFFDDFEAKVIGTDGTSILALVPRIAGAIPDVDNLCKVTVKVGTAEPKVFANDFRYRVSASVTTFAGNGENVNDFSHGVLSRVRFAPVMIGVDSEFNIFVTTTDHHLLRLDERAGTATILMTGGQGMNQHSSPSVTPDDVILLGKNDQRDRFTLLDPKDGWAPKPMMIRAWDQNGYDLPSNATHHYLLYCQTDGQYYSRYNSGQIVRIDPITWRAKIVGMTPSGNAYCGAFNPDNPSELWIGYDFGDGEGALRNSLARVDVLEEMSWEEKKLEEDPEYDFETNAPPYALNTLWTFEKLTGATGGDHRDGPIAESQFRGIRQINFDKEAGVIYIGDSQNYCIRMVNVRREGMPVSTLIGIPKSAGDNDGKREDARFREIHGIVADADGVIYASDWNNYKIRRIAVE